MPYLALDVGPNDCWSLITCCWKYGQKTSCYLPKGRPRWNHTRGTRHRVASQDKYVLDLYTLYAVRWKWGKMQILWSSSQSSDVFFATFCYILPHPMSARWGVTSVQVNGQEVAQLKDQNRIRHRERERAERSGRKTAREGRGASYSGVTIQCKKYVRRCKKDVKSTYCASWREGNDSSWWSRRWKMQDVKILSWKLTVRLLCEISPKNCRLKMWKRNFHERLTSKTEGWRCGNDASRLSHHPITSLSSSLTLR